MSVFDLCVIGGGLAGTAVCAAATKAGLRSVLVERSATVATGASGNARGLIVPYITTADTPVSALYHDAYTSIQREIRRLQELGLVTSVRKTGALQFPSAHRPKKLLSFLIENHSDHARLIKADEVSSLTGYPIDFPLVYYEDALNVSPPELCMAWLAESGASVYYTCEALSFTRHTDSWSITTKESSDTIHAGKVVIANAFDCIQFDKTQWLRVEPVRGQVMTFSTPSVLQGLQTALCYDGYALPVGQDRILLGASYDHNNMDMTVCEERNSDMLRRFEKWTSIKLAPASPEGRVSFRTSTHDRMPYVGSVPDFETIKASDPLWSRIQDVVLPLIPNLFVTVGHGSRGLLSAYLGAEIIISKIKGDENLHDPLLEPMRLIRQMIKHEEFRRAL